MCVCACVCTRATCACARAFMDVHACVRVGTQPPPRDLPGRHVFVLPPMISLLFDDGRTHSACTLARTYAQPNTRNMCACFIIIHYSLILIYYTQQVFIVSNPELRLLIFLPFINIVTTSSFSLISNSTRWPHIDDGCSGRPVL